MTEPTETPKPEDPQRVEARRLLDRLLASVLPVAEAQVSADAERWERVRLACRGLQGALVAGDGEEDLARRWAELRAPNLVTGVPWRALNLLLESFVGEEGAERVKVRAAALVPRLVRSGGRPAASKRRPGPSFTERLVHHRRR